MVVLQHVDDSASLRQARSVLVRAPHVRLRHLGRFDERINAHLDGIRIAGSAGRALVIAALERPGAGQVFTAATQAIEERDMGALDRLLAVAEATPDGRRGLLSAFGWLSATSLRGVVFDLLGSSSPSRREAGLSACRLQGVDPGPELKRALRDVSSPAHSAALRTAGELGRIDLLEHSLEHLGEAANGFWAARTACMLGDRASAPRFLENLSRREAAYRDWAGCLSILAGGFARGRDAVRQLAGDMKAEPGLQRRVVRSIGWLGDVQAVPWLIERMGDEALARIAGESFSLITGVDIADLDLGGKPPKELVPRPNDDPDDDDTSLDDDESLPWPAQDRVHAWWKENLGRLPAGSCCFVGATPTAEHCGAVLRNGSQRQRIIAALRLKLAHPDRPLFNVCAPAWRQERLLGIE